MRDLTGLPTCKAIKSDGTPCRAQLGLSDSSFCLSHDPARREQLRAMRAAGGRAGAAAKRARNEAKSQAEEAKRLPEGISSSAKTMDELVELQAFVLEQTRTKAMDARTSEALTKGIRNQQIMIEKRDLQREIQELRKELADAKRKALRVG